MRTPTGAGRRYRGGPDQADTQALPARPWPPVGQEGPGIRPAARRWLATAAWVGGSLALAALYLRISLSSRVDSDGGNNALQGWDLLHGHLLLHGWQIGDANFYFLELPLNAVTEALFGLGNFAAHAASALTYTLVAVCAAALALTGSRGTARAVRCVVVVMVLAAPLSASYIYLVLEEPDHVGTTVFILGSFLLIDRAPGRRFTVPLLLVILSAGQYSDLSVRYVAVPAIVLVCGYRALAARRLRSPDAALVAAAVASVPISALMTAATVHLGGFSAAATRGGITPAGKWAHNAAVTWMNIRILFGAGGRDTLLGVPRAAFGLACLLAAVYGLAWVAWRWRRASRAEQLLGVAIVVNIGVYLVTTFAVPGNSHELAPVLVCGAVLAARALVPARIASMPAAVVAVATTALVAALPLASAATRPLDKPVSAPLTTWLEAHGLRYGLAGYSDGAPATVQSGNRIQLRVVHVGATSIGQSHFEVNALWYDPSRYDARFVVADPSQKYPPGILKYPPAVFERLFGKPATTYRVDGWTILVYRTNLLRLLAPS